VACPDALVLDWAPAVLDTDVTVLRGLRHGGSPSLPRAGDREVVMWYGNTLWDDGRLTAVIDWDCAGAGPAERSDSPGG